MEQETQNPADVEAASILNAAPAESAPEPVAAESAPVEAAPVAAEPAPAAEPGPKPEEVAVAGWLGYIRNPRDITHLSEAEIQKEYDELLAVADHFRGRITPAIIRRYSALSDAIAEIRSVRETLGIRTD